MPAIEISDEQCAALLEASQIIMRLDHPCLLTIAGLHPDLGSFTMVEDLEGFTLVSGAARAVAIEVLGGWACLDRIPSELHG